MKSTGRKFKQRTHKKESADESTLQMSLEAFNLEEQFDNIYADMLNEASVKKLSKSAKSSIKGAVTTPAANNNAGDAYKSWRFGLALAGAPEFPTKAVNEIGGDPLLTTYTDEEWDMIQYAAKQSDVGPIKRVSSNRSVEKEDTNKLSAVAKIKRNKYGV
jgi:predicted GIY-YIG superfamily endonuclease